LKSHPRLLVFPILIYVLPMLAWKAEDRYCQVAKFDKFRLGMKLKENILE